MLLLSIDGYELADRRTDSHFFVDGFVGWITENAAEPEVFNYWSAKSTLVDQHQKIQLVV